MASSELLSVARSRPASLVSSRLSRYLIYRFIPRGLGNSHFSTSSTLLVKKTFACQRPIRRAVSTSTREGQVTVYRLPWIKHLRFISRVKIIHVAVVTALTWPMSVWYAQGIVSPASLAASIVAATATTAGLFGLSYFLRRVVGQIDINKDDGTMIISTLTFWGNRRNNEFRLSDIVPLSESGFEPNHIFHRLEVYNSPSVYLCSLRHGKIYDQDSFFKVIGLGLDGPHKNQKSGEEIQLDTDAQLKNKRT